MRGAIKTSAAESNRAELASTILPVRLKFIRFCVATAVASFSGLTIAAGDLPTAPQVTGGSASISQTGLHQTINQTTDRAIINWGSFSIGPSASVNFNQPSSTSVTLNRIVGNDPTRIFGSLTANGRVFLVNPNGVYFAPGSSIDTGGLVATTMAIKDSDFMSGILNFERSGTGEVENAGVITIRNGGYALLAADKVSNAASGRIDASGGQVLLASAERVTIDTKSDGLVGFSISGNDIREVASVENAGIITADGGRIALSAKGAQELTGMVVNNTGVLRAQSFEERDGVVILSASSGITKSSGNINVDGLHGGKAQVINEQGTTIVSGNISAKGSAGQGGDVQLLGNQVGLFDQVNVDASGKTGGGSVLVGGDYQGKNVNIQNAQRVVVGKDATITADATETGDGGKVILWSDNDTRFYGTASAKGGVTSGNGGFVEVSGKETLTFKGKVDTRASNGNTGTLLLDPTNIVIQNGSGDGDDADALTNSFAGGATAGTVISGNATPTTLFESELEGIAANTNISLAATNNITINNLTDNNLNLAQGSGNSVSFNSATFNMDASDTIRTLGGAININAGTMILGGLNSGSGAINLTSTDSGNSMSLANIDTTGIATFKSSGRIFQQANTRIAANTVTADNVNNFDVGLNNQVSNFNAINATGSSIFFKSVNNLNVSAITAAAISLNSGGTANIGNLDTTGGVIDVTTVGAATIGTLNSNGGAISILTSGATNVSQITSNGGNVSINGVGSKTFSNILSGGGDIVLNSANNIITGDLTAAGGAISIDNGSFGGNGSITAGSISSINSAGAASIFIKSGNSLILNGAVTATADATSNADVTIESKNNLTINQNIIATGGGTFGQKSASVSITSTNGNLTQTAGQIKALDTGAMQVDTDQNAHSAEIEIEASNGSITTKDILVKSDGGRGQANITARNGVTATGTIIVEAASQPGISINSEKNDGTGDINTANATIRATQESEVTVPATPPATGSSNKDINKIVDNAGGISVVGNNLNLGVLMSNSTSASGNALYGISTNSRNNTTFNKGVITNAEAGILVSTRGTGSVVQTTGAGILDSQALGLAGDRDKGIFKLKTNINSLTVLGGRGVDIDNTSHGSGILTISALGRISDATTDPNTNTEIPATNKPVGGARIQSQNIKLLSLDNQSTNTYKFDGTQTNVFLGSGRQDLKLIADNIEFVPATIQTKAATDVQLRPLTNNRNIQLASADPGVTIFNTSIYTGALVTGLLNQFNPASNLVIGGDNNGVAYSGNIYIGNTGDTASKQISLGNMNVFFYTTQRVYNNYAANPDTPFSWNDGAFTSAPYSPSPAVLCPSVSTACLTRLTTGKIYIKDSLLQGAVADNRRRNVVMNGAGNGLGGTSPTNNSTTGTDGGDGSGGDGSSSGGGGGSNNSNDNDSGPGGSNEASNGPSGGGNNTTTPGQTGTTTNTNNPGQSSGNPGGTPGTPSNPSTPGNSSGTPADAGGTNNGSLAGGGQFSGGDSGTNTASNPAGGGQNTGSNNGGNNPAGGGTLSGGTPPGSGTQVADNTSGPNGSGSSNGGGLSGGANNGNNSGGTGGGSLSDGSNVGGNLSGGGTQIADNDTGNSGGGFSGGGTSGGNSNSGGNGSSGGGTFSNGSGSGGNTSGGTQVADSGNGSGGFAGGGSSGNSSSSSGSSGSSGGGSFSNGNSGNSSNGTQVADSGNSGGFAGGGTGGNSSGGSGTNSSSTSGSGSNGSGNSTSSGGTGSSGGGSFSNGTGNNSGTGGNSGGNTQIAESGSGTNGLNGSNSGGFAGGASSGNGSSIFAGSGNASANSSGAGSNGGIGGGTFSDGSGIGGSSSWGTQLANNSSGSASGSSNSSSGGSNGAGNGQGGGANLAGGTNLGSGSSGGANGGSGTQVVDNTGIGSGSSNNGNANGNSVNSGGSGSGGAGNSGGSSFSGGASGGDGASSNAQLADNGQNNESGGFAGGATSTAGNAGSSNSSGSGSSSNADGSNGNGQNQTAGNSPDGNSNGATGNGNSTTTASDGDNNSPFAGGAGGGASGDATVVASNDNQQVEDLPACEDEGEGTKQITRAGQPNADMIQVKASGVRLRGNKGPINQQRASCVRATATN